MPKNTAIQTQKDTFDLKSVTVAVGSYEGGLLVYVIDLVKGFHVPYFSAKDNLVSFINLIILTRVKGGVKAIHISKSKVYTGGKDELVRVYSLKSKSAEGAIPGQTGTITKLLESEKFLFSAGSDGRVIISKNQQLYESLLCHTSQIVDFDIHQSGRLMVTIALDKKIKLWNLMNMKEVYHKNIMKNVDFIRFAPDNSLLLCMMENIAIFNTDSNSISGVIEHEARVTDIIVDILNSTLITGDDEGRIYLRKYSTEGPMSTIQFRAFDKRIKCMNLNQGHGKAILVAISTEGYIAVYDIEDILKNLEELDGKLMDLEGDFDPLYRFDIASRLISLGSRLNFLRRDLKKQELEDETRFETEKITKKIKKKDKKLKNIGEEDIYKFGRKFLENNKLGRVKYFKALLN